MHYEKLMYEPQLTSISIMFGVGLLVHFAINLVFVYYLYKKKKKRGKKRPSLNTNQDIQIKSQ